MYSTLVLLSQIRDGRIRPSRIWTPEILAEAHEHGYGGIAPWIVWIGVLAIVLVTPVVVVTVLVLLLRGKLPPEDEVPGTSSGGEPPAPPVSGAIAPDTRPGSTDIAEDPEQELQRYLEREHEIMAILKQRGCAVAQSELRQYLGVTAEELARALSDLEQRGFLHRTWDRQRQDFIVSRQES